MDLSIISAFYRYGAVLGACLGLFSGLYVITKVADRLQMKCYDYDYYGIDALLYREEDLVPERPPGSYWLRACFEKWPHRTSRAPDTTYAATLGALKAGAHGVILSRKYSQMRLANLTGLGREAIPPEATKG